MDKKERLMNLQRECMKNWPESKKELEGKYFRFLEYVHTHPTELHWYKRWLKDQVQYPDYCYDQQNLPLEYFFRRVFSIGGNVLEVWEYLYADELNKEETNNE